LIQNSLKKAIDIAMKQPNAKATATIFDLTGFIRLPSFYGQLLFSFDLKILDFDLCTVDLF